MPQLPKFTRLLTIQLLTILLAFSATTSCSKSAEKEEQAGLDSSLLQFVPADTPYLFANPEPLPDDVLDQLEPRFDEMLKAYANVIRTVVDAELEKAEEEGSTEKDEAARMAAHKVMVNGVGEEAYFMKVLIYPFHIMRENPLALSTA